MTLRAKLKKVTVCLMLFLALFPASTAQALSEKYLRMFSRNDIMFYDPEACAEGTGSVSTVGGVAVVSGTTAKEKIWSGLKSLNVTDEVAAGIMGNMSGESGFNPARYEDSHKSVWTSGFDWENNPAEGYGVGLIQWSGSRRVSFFKWMREQNNDLVEKYLKQPNTYGGLSGDDFIRTANNDAEVDALYSLEISFLIDEMKGNPHYAVVFDQNNVTDAAVFFSTNVEGCSTCTATSANTENRRKNAQQIYNEFHGKTSFGAGVTASTSTTLDGSKITVIGDSITNGARSVFEEKLPGIDIYAQDSKQFAGTNNSNKPGLTILKELKDGGKLRDVLVFALGTNGTVSPNAMNEMLATAESASKIVLVTNYANGAPMTENNNLFKQVASENSKVVVADWVEAIKGKEQEYLSSDGTHPKNKEANELFVDLIMQAIGNIGATTSQSTDDDCCVPGTLPASAGMYPGTKYILTDEQLKGLTAMAEAENGSTLAGLKSELSLMVNRFEKNSGPIGDADALVNYTLTGSFFAQGTKNAYYSKGPSYSNQEYLEAAKDVLMNGNHTLPPQIVEHDCVGDLLWVKDGNGVTHYSSGAGGCNGTGLNDKSFYERGKTVIQNVYDSQYIFWDWADPENKTGDPFGYFADNPPSDSALQNTKGTSATTASGSNVIWEDGWIVSGIDGYKKEPAVDRYGGRLDSNFGKDFYTDAINGEGKGPNKILLHSVEGPGGQSSGIDIYNNDGGKAFPPHFTIDIKNKKLFQHGSISKASAAIVGSTYGDLSAGVQIEILGYSDQNEANKNGHSTWYLGSDENFKEEDWAYLAEVLNAISVETGISLSSSVDWSDSGDHRLSNNEFVKYTGILAHKHAPGNDHPDIAEAVWKHIESAIAKYSGTMQDACSGLSSTGDLRSLQEAVLKFAWPEYHSPNYFKMKPEYEKVVKERISKGLYVGGGSHPGIDCGGFVTTLMQESGWDPNYGGGGATETQLNYLKDNKNGWTEVTDKIKSNADAQPGDVIIISNATSGHTLVYVGDIPGFNSKMASASYSEKGTSWRAPMADSVEDISYYVKNGYRIFRKVK